MSESQIRAAHVGRPWGNRLPFPWPIGPILTEHIKVDSIGHAFGQVPPMVPSQPPVYFVQDFLVDQSQSTGGGSLLADPIQFDLTHSLGYRFHIVASSGQHFHVNPPAHVAGASFAASLGRQAISPPPSGYFNEIAPQVSFRALIGTPPNLTYNSFFLTQTNNSALLFEIEGEVTSPVQFEAIILRADFVRAIDPGAKWYAPLSYAVPFGTKDIYPKSETFVLFGYQTSDAVDPGPFVTLR